MSAGVSRAAARVAVSGWGAVSPAGWSAAELLDALEEGGELGGVEALAVPGGARTLPVRLVPDARPGGGVSELRHPRLRRASRITRFGVAAALEALGSERRSRIGADDLRAGIVFSVMDGCVGYSARFFGEVLDDPSLASPILFPETVFNAPSSHLSSVLGSTGLNDTLVGGPAHFIAALGHAAGWLLDGRVDGVVVVGAEEANWLTTGAVDLFSPGQVVTEGAGALYLELAENPVIELVGVTDVLDGGAGGGAALQVRDLLLGGGGPVHLGGGSLLVDSAGGGRGSRAAEAVEDRVWRGWGGERTISPRRVMGEGLGARSAWQCAAAAEWLHRAAGSAEAVVSVLGNHGQAAGARFSLNLNTMP